MSDVKTINIVIDTKTNTVKVSSVGYADAREVCGVLYAVVNRLDLKLRGKDGANG